MRHADLGFRTGRDTARFDRPRCRRRTLPYYDDVHGAPQHTLVDGASLWIGEGRKPAEYKAAAAFIQFLLTPEIQVEITRMGGFRR